MYKVYVHECPNGKRYIGCTNRENISHRFCGGSSYRYSKEFYSDIILYGWNNIKHTVVFDGMTKEEARRKERGLIAYWKSVDSAKVYNKTKGGETGSAQMGSANGMYGKHRTEKERNHISEMAKKRFSNKINHPMFGTHRTEETKRKISESRKGKYTGENNPLYGKKYAPGTHPRIGKHHSEESKAKMRETKLGKILSSEAYNAKGVVMVETGETFGSVMDVKRKYGYDNSAVCKCCKTGKAYKGYHWEYI